MSWVWSIATVSGQYCNVGYIRKLSSKDDSYWLVVRQRMAWHEFILSIGHYTISIIPIIFRILGFLKKKNACLRLWQPDTIQFMTCSAQHGIAANANDHAVANPTVRYIHIPNADYRLLCAHIRNETTAERASEWARVYIVRTYAHTNKSVCIHTHTHTSKTGTKPWIRGSISFVLKRPQYLETFFFLLERALRPILIFCVRNVGKRRKKNTLFMLTDCFVAVCHNIHSFFANIIMRIVRVFSGYSTRRICVWNINSWR